MEAEAWPTTEDLEEGLGWRKGHLARGVGGGAGLGGGGPGEDSEDSWEAEDVGPGIRQVGHCTGGVKRALGGWRPGPGSALPWPGSYSPPRGLLVRPVGGDRGAW